MLNALSADLRALDWADLAAVAGSCEKLLSTLDVNRELLRELADGVLTNPSLLRLCEHYDILDKIILYDDHTGWRLRLHVFLPGYFDRPHNHRWTYSSRILTGSYVHTLYGTDEALGDDISPSALAPRLVRIEEAGAVYTLHHTMIHSVIAEPYSSSLVVRGPAVKDRFVVTDRRTGRAWWQYGAANEDPAAAARKRMSIDQARDRIHQLANDGVLG